MPYTTLVPIIIVCAYLVITTLFGFWQSRNIKKVQDYTVSKMSAWRVATFLAGYTLGGGATYGVAGDTIKFGLTYLIWFPLSVALGWIITGLIFARPYYRLNGITVPTFLANRFDKPTQLASSVATLIYAIFIILLEIYTLAIIIVALFPNISMSAATAISVLISVISVSFSGILGASVTNLIHSVMIMVSFSSALIVLWQAVGGWDLAIERILVLLPDVASPGVDKAAWLSTIGMGWGVAGQLLLGKAGRLGGISVVSHVSASCKSEKEAMKAFLLAGIVSGIPPFLSCLVGIFSAAFLGGQFTDLPVYSAIGFSLSQLNPVIGGCLLAAVTAGILSAYGPTSVVLSSVFVEDILGLAIKLNDRQKRYLYPTITILVSVGCGLFVAFKGIQDILPFLYTTAFPCTVPITVVVAFGLNSRSVASNSAFWAITLGLISALLWGVAFNNPFGIPNMYIAYFVPILIMTIGLVNEKYVVKTKLATP